jgi:pimeloyl-ACP methyl ester carboxylesterase
VVDGSAQTACTLVEEGPLRTTSSDDGTPIGFEQTGHGPPLVIVDGAMCYRGSGPSADLAAALASEFTVFSYDRRGRGESGDNPPYAVEREIEDLGAVIAEAEGSAFAYGLSSGAALAMAATAAGLPISKLALFEPPFTGEEEGPRAVRDEHLRLEALLAAGRQGDVVAAFLGYFLPPEVIAEMRGTPSWAALEATAPTLAYDHAVVGDGLLPRELASSITVPTLLMTGSESPGSLQRAAEMTAAAIPSASLRMLEGESHTSTPDGELAALRRFFG